MSGDATLISATDLRVAFNERVILDGASLSILDGDRVGLVGRNGCGKSTFIRILAELAKHGLAENTLVIMSSDNGPVLDDGYKDQAVEKLGAHKVAGPLRGGKYSVHEGGTRTPFIARWRGTVAPRVSDEVVCTIDLEIGRAHV